MNLKNILAVFLFVFVAACASTPKPAPQIIGPQLPTTGAPLPSAPGKLMAGDIVKQIYPKGILVNSPMPKLDMVLTYLKISAGGQNYNIFVPFRGAKEDLVLEQITSCQPECSQKFKAHFFENGKLKRTTRFEALYPKKKVDNFQLSFKSLLPNVKFTNDFVDWFRLPKKGTTVDVLVLSKAPGSSALRKPIIYRTGELEWDGSKFNFKELEGKPSKEKFSELN